MNAIRKILSPTNGQLLIDIPKEYKQKRFEVIILPIEDTQIRENLQEKINAFLKTLPAKEPDISETEIMSEIKAVRTERYGE